jgi:hypothetical protein
MLFLVLILSNIFCLRGFLLDTNNPQNHEGQTSGQYLKTTDYFDDQRLQQSKLDRTLALLSAQIQQMFDSLEQKIYNNGVQNETSKPNDYWEQKYRALEDNYNKLQTRVELLQTKYNVQQLELISMKNETMECKRCNYLQLESNYTRLQNRMESVEYEYTSWKGELISLRNRSLEHDKDIVDLKMLKNIQPIQDFHNLQKQVELINAQTHALNVNEFARRQDFLALYNDTVVLKRTLTV